MKRFNIMRLIDASAFESNLSDVAKDALVDYLIDTGATLDNINIDDMIVNGISAIDEDEYKEYKDDLYLLVQDGDTYYAMY